MADLQRFYRTYYAPNNCTMILVGDVDPERRWRWRERYFGAIRRGQTSPPVVTREPRAAGRAAAACCERPGQNPLLQYAYHAIAAADPREPALNLLQTILVGGDASRLHRALVEEQRAGGGDRRRLAEGFDPECVLLQATLPDGRVASSAARRRSMRSSTRLMPTA